MTIGTEEWPKTKLRNLAERITVGFVGSMSSLFVDEGIPLLRGQNIRPYSLDLTNLRFISPDTHRQWKKSALRSGDVVIVRVGYPGTACVIPEGLGDMNAASLVIVRPDLNVLSPTYLSYVINSPWGRAQVAGRLVGAAQQVFNTQTAAEMEIPCPPLVLQKRIAGILSAYDELIENCQRRIKILEAMARNLYREWFVHFRYPGHESVPRVASSLGEIPEGWEVKRLGELAAEVRRGVAKGILPEPQRLVELEHMPRRSLALDSWETTSLIGSNKLRFKKGDILFGKIRPYFHKVCVAPFDGLCSADTIVISSRDQQYNSIITHYVSSDEMVALATATSNGSRMPRANWLVMSEQWVAVPPTDLAREFSAMSEAAIGQMQTLVSSVKNLRCTRDLLLPRLLSGQEPLDAN